ncbi:MAG TPA: DUF2461 domain-containing protein [Actinomycetota bacterium]|nr:DUF2461 domain-containing protein [Actinomycetota bacterium]
MAKKSSGPDRFPGWPPEALDWFRGLEANNSREWFQAHRATYDQAVRGPLELLLSEVAGEFGDGKVSRPNRDIRFSPDKTPYKNRIYAVVGRPAGGGGWYVQLNKEGIFAGGGLHAPDSKTVARIRAAIADETTGPDLERIVGRMAQSGVHLFQELSLRTAPRGYASDHPRIELLRLKVYAAGVDYPAEPWLHTPEAKNRVVSAWRAVTPLLEWLGRVGA